MPEGQREERRQEGHEGLDDPGDVLADELPPDPEWQEHAEPRLKESVASYVDGASPATLRPCSMTRSVSAIHVAVSSSLMNPANVACPDSTIGAA
jgi:hypothetical protein